MECANETMDGIFLNPAIFSITLSLDVDLIETQSIQRNNAINPVVSWTPAML